MFSDQKHRIYCPTLFILFFTSLPLTLLPAQKYLQIEKNHTRVKMCFHPGDMITLKTHSHPQWISGYISRLDVENDLLMMEELTVTLAEITSVRIDKPIVNPIMGNWLIKSGISVGGTAALARLFYKAPNARPFIIGGCSGVLMGFMFKQLSKNKRAFPINKTFHLRIVDTNFYNF